MDEDRGQEGKGKINQTASYDECNATPVLRILPGEALFPGSNIAIIYMVESDSESVTNLWQNKFNLFFFAIDNSAFIITTFSKFH